MLRHVVQGVGGSGQGRLRRVVVEVEYGHLIVVLSQIRQLSVLRQAGGAFAFRIQQRRCIRIEAAVKAGHGAHIPITIRQIGNHIHHVSRHKRPGLISRLATTSIIPSTIVVNPL